MIVRILSEGQYQLTGDSLIQLDKLDHRLTEAITGGNNLEFSQTFNEMLEIVRKGGRRLGDEILIESDLVLPAPDTTLSQAKQLFTGNIMG